MNLRVEAQYIDKKTHARAMIWSLPRKGKDFFVFFQYLDGEERGSYHEVPVGNFRKAFREVKADED